MQLKFVGSGLDECALLSSVSQAPVDEEDQQKDPPRQDRVGPAEGQGLRQMKATATGGDVNGLSQAEAGRGRACDENRASNPLSPGLPGAQAAHGVWEVLSLPQEQVGAPAWSGAAEAGRRPPAPGAAPPFTRG